MKTVDEELKPETVQTLDLRGDIGFLLKDEVEAIDGYDKVLSRAELTEEQRNVLEEIRNDELDHVNKLNEIYRTLATGDIEEDNEIVRYNDEEINDSVKYTLFGEVFEPDANGMKVNGKYFTKEKMEEIYNKYKNVNIMNKPSAILFYQAFFKKNYPLNNFKKIGDSYRASDAMNEEFTGAGYNEADVNEPLNPMCDEELEDGFLDNVLSKGLGVVNNMVNQLDEDTVELELEDDMPVEQQIKNYLKENGRDIGKLKLVGISQPEIEVYLDNEYIGKWNRDNKQMNDSAEKVDEIMNEALEAQKKLKDTDTTNDIGYITEGNQYRWEEKYGNTLLTVLKADTEIRLALDRNGTYLEIPREKFEEMIRSGKLKATETVIINKYSDVETLKDYKVKVGDKTFIVSASSAKDAKNKIKTKLGE